MDHQKGFDESVGEFLLVVLGFLGGVILGLLIALSTSEFKEAKHNENMFTECLNGGIIRLDSKSYVKCEVTTSMFKDNKE